MLVFPSCILKFFKKSSTGADDGDLAVQPQREPYSGRGSGTGRQNGGIATDALAALSIHEQRYQKIKTKIRREKAKG